MSRGTKTKTTIELNGQLYDARTGKVISQASVDSRASESVPKHHSVKPAPVSNVSNGKVVDGFIRRPQTHPTYQAAPPKPVEVNKPATYTPKPNVARAAPAHAAFTMEKSKTLMRPAVKKPKAVVAQASASIPEHRFKKENHERMQRAADAQKSASVRRFHPVSQHKIVKKEAVLPIARQTDTATRQISNQVAHLATSTEARVKQSVDVIEESLRNASAHLEKFEDNVASSSLWTRFGFRNKAANLASFSFVGLLLVGFFAYQNAPNIEMRLAATKSGVSAHMPGYSPAGFSASRDIQSEPGKVSVTFRSNTDDKKFTVSQQASNWSSDSLLSSHVLAGKQPYQTYQDEGKTVYISDKSATWVNAGVWYQIDGDASLTSDQLLRIANSL